MLGHVLRRFTAVLLLLLLVPVGADAATRRRHRKRAQVSAGVGEQWPAALDAALEKAGSKPPGRPSGLSVEIAELDSGNVVFSRNPEQRETIASITKMFTTAMAIHYLGPDYKFKTSFWRRGEIKDGQLIGSLLVVGGGDPNISGRFYHDDFNAIFDQWAQGLQKLGIQRVTGDLILNASFFDDQARNPEWPSGQEAKWYQAPISALSYNDNVVLVSIHPGKPGRPAAVSIDPPTGILHPLSSAKTVGRQGAARLAVARSAGSSNVTVSGTVPARVSWWSTPIAIDDAPRFFGLALRNRLQNAGVQVTGDVVEQALKPDSSWQLVAETQSDLLPTLAVTNKHSQGFYAEQLFKTVAGEKVGRGSWPNGLLVERQFLADLGLDPARYDLHDGSGLSPNNRVAAADLVAFLRAMSRQPHGAQWKTTLAIGGDPDGTLRHRFREAEMRGRIVAKTGTIQGVSTLAGYATADSGKTYAFAILLNGRGVYDGAAHAYQDRLLRALVKRG
jgi:D-alanyl-D-alanine carboxypeptidase/D-alanyl-D-alanine-endopeptidase (penicillin-binding protein 4)